MDYRAHNIRSQPLYQFCILFILSGFSLAFAWQSPPAQGDIQIIDVAGTNTAVKLWRSQGEDFYAVSENGAAFSAPVSTAYDLKLRYARFDPLRDPAPIVAEPFRATAEGNLYIVQFMTQPLEAYRQRLRSLGGEIYFFLADHSYIVLMTPPALENIKAQPFVRWVGPYHPAYRLEEFMLDNLARAATVFPSLKYNIMVFKAGRNQKHSVAEKIQKLGGTVDREHAGKYLLEATLTPEQLFRVVTWDEVLFVDRWSPGEADMDKARELFGANHIETVAGYNGTGVRGEVIDLGFNTGHVDFASRPLIEHTTVNSDSHGAATSGIVFGDGAGDPNARGILPMAQGIVADWDVVSVGQPRYDHTGELVADPYNAVFQTASVGSARTLQYSTISADTDAALFDFDIVHCQSQSNAGDQMSRPQAWAKNIISGGGIQHQDTLDRTDDCWCNGASIGPATDGRIKPDLSAFYDDILTVTTGSNTSYTTGFGGTSGATPIICGYVGLVFEMWADGIFGNTVTADGTVFDNRCHMTTAKALLINTATQYPFTGAGVDLTRVHQGWGTPDMQYLYDMREKLLVVDEADLLENMASIGYTVNVLAGEAQLKATLVFADPPGNPSSSQHRINDLSLKVTSPSGDVFWGNNGLLEGNYSTPDGTPNQVDTVENVFISNPEVGAWNVEIFAHEINQDSHVETVAVDADFALVVSGGVLGPGFNMTADPSVSRICAPADAAFQLDLTQILNFNEQVNLSATGLPAGASVTFSANQVVPPAMVTMTLSGTGAAAPGDYQIQVEATAPSMSRFALVDVNIANDLPGAQALTSPANAAIEVGRMPELDWMASTQTIDYQLELASDAAFNNVVYSQTTLATSHGVTIALDSLTEYFWRVKGGNGCGESDWSAGFSFTTLDQPDYFTQSFAGNLDLDNRKFLMIPDGTGDYYRLCSEDITLLPTDPGGGMPLALGDDANIQVNLATPVSLYGTQYGAIFVGSNGYITFNSGDTSFTETLQLHFNQPRVSALFDDLSPNQSGTVSYKELADRVAVTWQAVTEYNAANSNTFQIELFHNGEVHVSYLGMAAMDGISGLSQGNGVPADYLESDLSLAGSCDQVNLCPADLNGDTMVNISDLLSAADDWRHDDSPADLNGDGIVNLMDMVEILTGFGPCPQAVQP